MQIAFDAIKCKQWYIRNHNINKRQQRACVSKLISSVKWNLRMCNLCMVCKS